MIYIGCHLSASGGFMHMAKNAVLIGGDTFQFFTRNPRGGKAKPVPETDAVKYTGFAKEHKFGPIIAHAPYTLNPCSADKRILEFAHGTLADDLVRMEYVPGNYYNLHPGSHVGQGIDKGMRICAETLDAAMDNKFNTTVLLETMSGKGSEIGSHFEELESIIEHCSYGDKLGICFDTCHTYDAGYDIVNDLEGVLRKFDRIIGIDRLMAVHLNDSKNPFRSHKDRHEKIGEGSLGAEVIKKIVSHPVLKGRTFILETLNDLEGYAKEISLLREAL